MELENGNAERFLELLRPTRRSFLRGAGLVGLAAAFPDSLIRPLRAVAASVTGTSAVPVLSNGNRVLLERGVCLGAWVTTAETGRYIPTAAEWEAIGFNTVVWYEEPYFDAHFLDALPAQTQWGVAVYPNNSGGPHLPGPPPAGTQVLGDPDQRANVDRLFSICIGDEEGYSDQVVSWVQQWIDLGRQQLGEDHLFQNNQYLGEWGTAQLQSYVGQAHPDVVTYDNYPFNSTDPYLRGNRPEILDGLNSYRIVAEAGADGTGREPIAFGIYTEGYKGGNYDYVPSESEILFNHHAIWAFGGKWAVMFRWENDPGYFFFYRADGSHTPQFSQFGTALRQSTLLSPYLVRLQNRGVSIDLGKHTDSSTGAVTLNAKPTSVDLWDSYATPYLESLKVTNTGGANGGLRGDAILGSFVALPIPKGVQAQALSASDSDILTAENTKYLMLLNGLFAPNSKGGYDASDGFAAQSRQQFTLTLPRVADKPSQVHAVDLTSGHLVALKPIAHTKTNDTVRLELDGGTSTLLCIRTGGPTVDVGPTLDVSTANTVTDANGQVTVTAKLSNSTSKMLSGIAAQLELPDGWTASPADPVKVGRLAAGASTRVSWTVQSAADANPGSYELQVLATWPYADDTTAVAGGRSGVVVHVPYATGPVVSFKAPSLKLDAGASSPVTMTFTNPSGAAAATVNWELYAPAGGVTASPATGTTTVPAGGSTDVSVNVSVAAGAAAAVRTLAARATAGSAPFIPRSLPIQTGATTGTAKAVVATYSTPSATVIDTGDGTVTAVPVGNNPGSVIVSGDGGTAWVANQSSASVTRIDLTNNSVVATVTVGNIPAGLALTPDGTSLWVTNYGDANVQQVDVATNTAGRTIKVGKNPEQVTITPDGRWLYTANQGSSTVTPVDLSTNTAGPDIPVQNAPFSLTASPDATTVYCGTGSGSTVVPILAGSNKALSPITVSGKSYGLRVSPDGGTLWVADSGSNTVTPVDTATGLSGTPVTVGNTVSDVALTWDGATGYTACAGDNTVVSFDTGTGKAGAPITTSGKYPLAIAVTPLPVQ